MEDFEWDAFRETLLSQRSEIGQLTADSKEASQTVTLDQSKVGRLSRMDALQAQQMAQETTRRRALQLQKIDNALRRLEAGDYGCCFKCAEEISIARLRFDPASTRCTTCMDS